jgi:hypothetical protein
MEAFNYLAVLISIILGLGIAQLLSGFGRWIEHRSEFRPFAPAIIWAAVLLVVHIQTWWSMFGLRFLSQWTFVSFAFVLLQPIVLYLLATLALPSQGATTIDLRVNYFRQRRWFFALLALLLVVSVIKDLVISGALPNGANLGFHGAFLAATITALSTEGERYHQAVAVLSAVTIVAYVGLLFGRLQ